MSYLDQWRFTFVNECEGTVWPASFTTGGDSNNQTIVYSLRNGDTYTMTTPRTWNGQLWGRTHCEGKPQNLNFSCAIGDCGTGKMSCDDNQVISPVTVAEFRVGDSNLYYYNVNVVEGFNIPLAVTPVRRSGKHVIKCSSAGCPTNLNTMCPAVALNCSTESYKIIFCPASSTGSLNQSVSVRDSLTAENGTTYWLSPSGDFAFGFFQLPNELFLLAIWYAKIQNDSIIWYANGDSPAPKGSRLVLNDSHGLVLTSPEGSELWKSSEFTLAFAALEMIKGQSVLVSKDIL
ncbi:hypothetical protein TSUD_56990 [Trifolium subterraneum]|uniref:Bulb-type lectin domain-containing protein n=1 Tax=Trifolium subterraneum TaxID=3900 RepID=A0A2Z6P2F8_TRISU|nr:hypothetical protein TSUD_56990 [Trifolium subterraneum]